MVGQSEVDISDCKFLKHVATAIFDQNRLKSRTIGASLSYSDILPLVHSTFNPCKLINSNSTLAYEIKTAKLNVKTLKFNK